MSRTDWTSAAITAKAQGVRVEVLSQRSETSRVWVHPDGVIEEEAALGQVRFVDETAADGWREIDTTLLAGSDGTIAPVAVPVGVVLGTGTDELIVFDQGGAAEVGLSLDGVRLPTPVLEGPTATYPEVLPGVDVSVEVRSAGFEVLWLVKTPEAAQLLVERFGTDTGEVALPTRLRSVIAPDETPAGDVRFMQVGEVKAILAAPSMWDSSAAVPGAHGAETDVTFEIAPAEQSRGTTQVAEAESERGMDVVAPVEWLTDPDRVFPLVIDPTYQMVSGAPTFDTWVQNGVTVDKSAAGDLRIGNDGTGMVARSFLNFDASLFKGRMIRRANLSLFGSYSSTCAQTEFAAYDAGLASTSTRWTSQPTLGAKRATSTSTVGQSASCPAARVSIDMTVQAQAWSTSSAAQVGMMLGATNILDVYGWKIFHSSEGQNKPVIAVFYNREPETPAAPAVAGMVPGTTSQGPKNFVGAPRPALSVTVKDPDVDTATAVFQRFTSATSTANPVELCRASAASGGVAKCTPSADLPANASIWIRATVTDGMGWSLYSPPVEVRYGGATPPTPVIACVSANGSWTATKRAAETCTITAKPGTMSASAPTSLKYRINGGAWQTQTFVQLTADRVTSITLGGVDGAHSVEAKVISPVNKESDTASYGFGYGSPSLVAPAATLTTHGVVPLKAKGIANASGMFQWRVKGTETWREVTGSATTSGPSGELSTVLDAGQELASAGVSSRVSVVLEVRARYQVGTLPAAVSGVREIVRVPHAFGAGFPTTDVAAGQVALWTGELQVSDTDAELATPGGGLSISRTHSTWATPAGGPQAVFGPGWTSSLDGGPTGVSEMELVDNTRIDGTLVLASAEGDVLPFAPVNASRRTGLTIPAGRYLPIGPDAEASELTLSVTTVSGKVRVTATDTDGISTLFTATAPASGTVDALFVADSVTDQVTGETTSYRYNTAGLVSAIVAPRPDGITADCQPGVHVDGCRMLKLTYTGTGTATRLVSVTAQVNTEADKTLATYTYTSGRLTSVTDAVTGLTTTYTWTGTDPQPKLASVTPPGESTFAYIYDAAGKLSKVTRPVPASAGGGTAQLAGIVYNIAPSGIAGLNLAQFDRYQLPRTATKAFAVFGPDAPITGTPPAADEKWKRSDVWLTDNEGYTIHEGRYGGGAWQLTANIYDASDNVVQAWDTRATAELRKGASSLYSDVASAATLTRYNQEPILAADGTVVVPARTRITDVYTPAAMILTTGAEAPQLLRRHAATLYDQGAPQPGMSLPTTQTVTAERLDGTIAETLQTTLTGYAALHTGDKTGWDLRQATSVTLDMNGNNIADGPDIRRETRYDTQGRVIEQRQPGAGSTDPGTRSTVFWSAGPNPRDPACGNQPKWAGYLCKEGPASQPAGVTIPVTMHRDYTWHGQAATSQDISGPVTRTTATTYDDKTRPETVATTLTGMTGSTPIPTVTTTYDAHGRVTGTSSTAGTTAMTYDAWGRQTTYTTTAPGGTAETTTTVYNTIGDVASVTTPKSTTQYTYDGTDANGNPEHRGLLTKTVTTVGTFTTTSTAAYDPQGQLVLEKLPAGIQRETSYDLTGELVDQQYWGPSPTGLTPWLGWSITANAAGQIVSETHPEATPGTGNTEVRYTYDKAGRLIQVNDTTTIDGNQQCVVRGYLFDKRGNRLGNNETTATTCTATTPAATRSYDTADRPLTAGDATSPYTYDPLGRQLTIPAIDAPNPTDGPITLGYHHDDTAHTITQTNTTLTYTLDDNRRRTTQTTTTNGQITNTVVNHYTDNTDNPHWITTTSGTTQATTVYTDQVSADLTMAIITDTTGTRGELAITTPRGDIATTITINTPTSQANGIDTFTRHTEYGQPTTTPPTNTTGTAANGYHWLGAKQRTTTTTGILLMGARLYNPTTALFTSLDPIHGGNDTPYTYPNDPINKTDTTGRAWWETTLVVASLIPGPVGAAASVALAVAAVSRGDLRGAGLALIGPIGKAITWGAKAHKLAKLVKTGVYSKKLRAAIYATHRGWGKRQSIIKSVWDDRRTIVSRPGMSSRQSLVYHYAKHGGKRTVRSYQQSAKRFRDSNYGKRTRINGSPGGFMNGSKIGSHW